MKYNIEVAKKALKQLKQIPMMHQERIYKGIRGLQDSETWGDVKRLVNHQYDYRLRVGDYRVLFDATDDKTIEINDIMIEEVKKRDNRTY